jgi:hypothetical protein
MRKTTGKKPKSLKKVCDELLRELCLLRAQNKSELSGKSDETLQVHHIVGKPSLFLRYHLDNCIVLTAGGEHFYGIHNPNREEYYRELIKSRRGSDIYERLELFKRLHTKSDMTLIKLYLEQEIKKFKNT